MIDCYSNVEMVWIVWWRWRWVGHCELVDDPGGMYCRFEEVGEIEVRGGGEEGFSRLANIPRLVTICE